MDNLFALLLLATLVLFVIGFFKPRASLFWDKKDPTKKKSAIIYSGFSLLFFILLGGTSKIQPEAKSTYKIDTIEKTNAPINPIEKQVDMPAEQKLAVLDANTFVDTTEIKVIRIKTLLNNLSKNYGQSRDTIAEYTSRAQGVLHDKGIKKSCLEILEDIHKAGKIQNTPFKDAVTLYLMLPENQ